MADRMISGGDTPEATLATLKKNHGWVQPILYQEKINPNKPSFSPPGFDVFGHDPEAFTDTIEGYPGKKPGPGTATKIAYILYDEEKK